MSTLTLRVPDMSCGHCVATISKAVSQVEGVADVTVDLDDKRVDVEGQGLEPRAIEEVIRAAGYEPAQA